MVLDTEEGIDIKEIYILYIQDFNKGGGMHPTLINDKAKRGVLGFLPIG